MSGLHEVRVLNFPDPPDPEHMDREPSVAWRYLGLAIALALAAIIGVLVRGGSFR